MCCLLTVLLFIGPRAGILVWALIDPVLWDRAFDSFIWPLLGFIFLPWTTLMFVLVSPAGFAGIAGLDWMWLGLGFLADISSYAGGGYGNRSRR